MKDQDHILVLEDDEEQVEFFVEMIMAQVSVLLDDPEITQSHKTRLKNLSIIKVTNVSSLNTVVEKYDSAVLAILDGNVPDREGGFPKDQFIKSNHRITGQHASVDRVYKGMQGTPIILTSSMDRFKIIVTSYYRKFKDIDLRFVRKGDLDGLNSAIFKHLKAMEESID